MKVLKNPNKVKAMKRKSPQDNEESSKVNNKPKTPQIQQQQSTESEYLVGSISDLITGKNTPNKPKIVKQILPKKVREVQDSTEVNLSQSEEDPSEQQLHRQKEIKPKSKKKKSQSKLPNETEHNLVVIDHSHLLPSFEDDEEEFEPLENPQVTNKQAQELENAGKTLTEAQINAQKEADTRTIFVGNVATSVTKAHLMKLFRKFGPIQSVRLRGIAPQTPGLTKRVAAIKKLYHAKRSSFHAYVVFEKREDAVKAVELNGFKFQDHFLRVELCDSQSKHENNKAIFLGNLSFEAEDDDLWTAFESCGPIKSVRIVRNSATGVGLGIGYVNFEFADSVELALQMGEVKIKKKFVRIKRYQSPKNKSRFENNRSRPKFKESKVKNRVSESDQTNEAMKKNVFRGKKALKKKKKPRMRGELAKKMKLSQKIAPKTSN